MELIFDNIDKYESLLPTVKKEDTNNRDYEVNWWEINQTISQLAYLTHDFFRYYGKFPPTIVSYLLKKYPCPPDGCLLDNFSGSGTSLVEAARRGIPAVGIDINPLACLSGVVKTTLYNIKTLRQQLQTVKDLFYKETFNYSCVDFPEESFLEKWFFEDNITDLKKLKSILIYLQNDIESDFFVLAFLAVIRRLSKAYDGEVRPHINRSKKMKEPFACFEKKVNEMILSLEELANDYPDTTPSQTYNCDTTTNYIERLPSKHYWLVLSHPPYLNCFDYIAVFKLELEWSLGFKNLWMENDLKTIKKLELKSWPAKGNLIQSYYDGLKRAYTTTYNLQRKGDKLAVVIGDCTINGVLEPVHLKLIDILTNIGYKILELNYRTTNYTTGKYAYKTRADYQGREKRDAIIICEKEGSHTLND